ncbi:MAG: glutamate synthase subunit alpha, partial [Phycisphaeraceae bacterium]
PSASTFNAEEQIIIGNVALYGSTKGEAYFNGKAAERFAVRNSGARAVVEGVGDHGCEYMTGGRVVVLGPTGRNFAAGMSGGIAYIWDKDNEFLELCNLELVELENLDHPEDEVECLNMIKQHAKHTGSTVAHKAIDHWEKVRNQIVKVMPIDYRRVLQQQKKTAATPDVGHA